MGVRNKESLFTGNFAKLFFASLLLFTAFYVLLPTFPVYLSKILHFERDKTGIIMSLYTVAALAIRPFSGYFIERYGRKWFYIASFFAFALIYLTYGISPLLAVLVLIRFMHGLAWGVATTTGSTLCVDFTPTHRRGEGIGLFGLSMTIPMALGPFLGLNIIEHLSYVNLFEIAALIGFLAFLVTLFIHYPKPPDAHLIKFNWKNLIERTALPVTLNLLLINISYGGLVTFVSLYAIETGIGLTSTFFIVFAIGITLARIIGGKVFDRRGPALISMLGIGFLIAGYFLLGTIISAVSFILAAFLTGLGSGVLMPSFQAMVNNMIPQHRRGAANSTLFTGLDLGIGLGMILTGILSRRLGLPHTYLIFSLLNFIALVYFYRVSLRHYRQHKKQE